MNDRPSERSAALASPLVRSFSPQIPTAAGEREELVRAAAALSNVISLHRGDPDLPPPQNVLDATKNAAAEQQTHYTHWQGLPELRAAIAAKLRRENDLQYGPEEIIVTAGAQEALFLAIVAFASGGGEVLVADPHYSAISRIVAIAGGTFVPVPTRWEDGFALDAGQLRKRITARTKMLVMVDPHNPTGTLLSHDRLRAIADVAAAAELVVLSDEIYERLVYDDAVHESIAGFPGMRDRAIVVNGFSKSYCMTGFRLGYLAAPADVVRAMQVLREAMTICPSSISQWAGVEALAGPADGFREIRRTLAERRALLMSGLDEIPLPYVRPQAGMYLFADIREFGLSSFGFCQRLLDEARVLASPGSAFGAAGEGFVRFSWLVPADDIRTAIERLGQFVISLRRKAAPPPRHSVEGGMQ